jgi:hypothetical protein
MRFDKENVIIRAMSLAVETRVSFGLVIRYKRISKVLYWVIQNDCGFV